MKSDWCVCLDLTTVEFCWLSLVMFSVKFNGSSPIGIWVVPCGRADLTKRIIASRIFANAPKTFSFYTLEVASMAQVAGFTTPKSCFFQAHSQNCENRLWASSCLSVRPPLICPSAWDNSASTERILMKFGIWDFFPRKSVEKIQVWLKSDKDNG